MINFKSILFFAIILMALNVKAQPGVFQPGD